MKDCNCKCMLKTKDVRQTETGWFTDFSCETYLNLNTKLMGALTSPETARACPHTDENN